MFENYEKMLFRLNPQDWHRMTGERIWAEPVGNGNTNIYRLHNSPFYAHGVSYLDVVRGIPEEDGEGLEYGGTIEKSGHSTIWLMVPAGPGFDYYWPSLQDLGCTYEGSIEDIPTEKRTLYAVDVPPTADIERVIWAVNQVQARDVWAYQVGHLAHKRVAR
jgi:hypothetical protein